MWERAHLTAATESADLGGLTWQVGSENSGCVVAVNFDATWSRFRLSTVSGEYVYQSEWLDVSPLLEPVVMVPLLRAALGRWRLLALSPYSKQKPTWTPLELTMLLYNQIEHLLA